MSFASTVSHNLHNYGLQSGNIAILKFKFGGRHPENCCSVRRLRDQMEVFKTLNGCENVNTNICSQER